MFRNQKGASLPYVIGLAAIIVANTYYFLGLDENSIKDNKSRGHDIALSSEKKRIGTFLSDTAVCTSPDNFGGKTIATINGAGANPLRKNAINFLEFDILYANRQLRFKRYQIAADPNNVGLTPDKQNSLYVTYAVMESGNETAQRKIMRIPLSILVDGGGAITSCYADPSEDLNTIESALADACLGNGAVLSGGQCVHDMTPFTCPNPGFVLNGVSSVAGVETYTCGTYTGGASAPCAANNFIVSIGATDNYTCASPGPACPGGSMLVLNGLGPGCASSCPALTLYQGMSGTGTPTCFPRPASCPPGQYAREISPSGVPVCEPYSLVNKSCGPGMYATRINAASSVASIALGCAAYSKSKSCASPGPYTFIRSLTSATPSCHTYTN